MIYLDTSAAAKALIEEEGSAAVVRAFANGSEFVSSRLLAVELHAIADRRSLDREAVVDLLDRVALVSLDNETLTAAVRAHSGLRTLDALHLAAALELGDVITSFLTFDNELAAAARAQGLSLAVLP
ncbi:PIN domain-containing protein [Microbacterium sp. BLY]|uniref:PIN domain-containing protein n=1 Tax=Microbacterium sp. BLY TaxID=2823280 RepID=UPI001B31F737|nr:PIN domain-containing protein [Microbacterium sp. BLY]MBP3977112.1 PIN domain-containing protein [Microbacterium sp. BLY]